MSLRYIKFLENTETSLKTKNVQSRKLTNTYLLTGILKNSWCENFGQSSETRKWASPVLVFSFCPIPSFHSIVSWYHERKQISALGMHEVN